MRKLNNLLAIGALVTLGILAYPATPAQCQVGVQVTIAPPAARVETIPASPARGAIWTPGYYQWDPAAQNYIWVAGSWQVPPHKHMLWIGAHTIERKDGSYVYYSGHWATKHQAHEEREAEEDMER